MHVRKEGLLLSSLRPSPSQIASACEPGRELDDGADGRMARQEEGRKRRREEQSQPAAAFDAQSGGRKEGRKEGKTPSLSR